VNNLNDKDNLSQFFREISSEYLIAIATIQTQITDSESQITNLNSKLQGLRLRMKNMSSLCAQGCAIPEFSRHMSSLQLNSPQSTSTRMHRGSLQQLPSPVAGSLNSRQRHISSS